MGMKDNRQVTLVPEGVVVLTAGVDVQDDRLEVEVVGWGRGEESWSVDYRVLHGDPAKADVWRQLDDMLQVVYEHQAGLRLRITATCIDTGGHHTQQAYIFVKPRQVRRVWAVKGMNQPGRAVVGRPSKSNALKVLLFPLGVDTAKEVVFTRLKIQEFGYGYMHFPMERNEEYFKQLTAERPVTKFVRGKQTRLWVKKRARNEALDCRIYALAALYILNPNMEIISDRMEEKSKEPPKEEQQPERKPPERDPEETRMADIHRQLRRRRGGFVNNW